MHVTIAAALVAAVVPALAHPLRIPERPLGPIGGGIDIPYIGNAKGHPPTTAPQQAREEVADLTSDLVGNALRKKPPVPIPHLPFPLPLQAREEVADLSSDIVVNALKKKPSKPLDRVGLPLPPQAREEVADISSDLVGNALRKKPSVPIPHIPFPLPPQAREEVVDLSSDIGEKKRLRPKPTLDLPFPFPFPPQTREEEVRDVSNVHKERNFQKAHNPPHRLPFPTVIRDADPNMEYSSETPGSNTGETGNKKLNDATRKILSEVGHIVILNGRNRPLDVLKDLDSKRLPLGRIKVGRDEKDVADFVELKTLAHVARALMADLD